MAVFENIAVREAAETLIELGCELLQEGNHDVRKFWSAVAAMATDRAGLTKELQESRERHAKRYGLPMTDKESRSFGNRRIQFGKYAETRYDEVPLSYLEWLAQQQSEAMEIVRYVLSRRVRAEAEALGAE